MGLRLRLNLVLSALFSVAVVLMVAYLLGNARRAVEDEMRASTEFAAVLLSGLVTEQGAAADASLIEHLVGAIDRAEHLRHLRLSTTDAVSAPLDADPTGAIAAPGWFAGLVRPRSDTLSKSIVVGASRINIFADPGAEIVEAWRDTRVALITLLTLFVGANVIIYVWLGRALEPLSRLTSGLGAVEQGRFHERLPDSGIPDIDRINQRFNDMSEALARTERESADLAMRSQAMLEQERRHLSHELHDEMGQSITAIKAVAVSIRDGGDPVIAERAGTIIDVSSSIYQQVRQMMTRLHPVIVDELGLVVALESMVDDWNTHHNETFCVLRTGTVGALDSDQRIGVYRIIQEALTNVARHASASEVTVDVHETQNEHGQTLLSCTIRDDGAGFAPETHRDGLGLRGIRERVKALRGDLTINASPGHGVAIEFVFPTDSRSGEDAQT